MPQPRPLPVLLTSCRPRCSRRSRPQALHQVHPPPPGRCCPAGRSSLAADHLVLVVLACQDLEGGLDDAAAQAQDQVQGGLCGRTDGGGATASAGLCGELASRLCGGDTPLPALGFLCTAAGRPLRRWAAPAGQVRRGGSPGPGAGAAASRPMRGPWHRLASRASHCPRAGAAAACRPCAPAAPHSRCCPGVGPPLRGCAHPSGCCSRPGCGRPPAACRRRSGAADPGGCLRPAHQARGSDGYQQPPPAGPTPRPAPPAGGGPARTPTCTHPPCPESCS